MRFFGRKQSPAPAQSEDTTTFKDNTPTLDYSEKGLFAVQLLGETSRGEESQKEGGLSRKEREHILMVARRYAVLDPITRQTLRVWTNHALGSGMTVQIGKKVKGKTNPEQVIIEDFIAEPTNAKYMSPIGQRQKSDSLLIDGNRFTILHKMTGRKVKIRRMDSLEVTDIITNPVDLDEVWFYVRETTGVRSGKVIKRLYRDIAIADVPPEKLLVPALDAKGNELKVGGKIVKKPFEPAKDEVIQEDVVVIHSAINTTGIWGNSLFSAQLIWAFSHRDMMEDRVTLRKVKTIAWERIIKGGKSVIDAVRNAAQSTLGIANPRETNPPSIPAHIRLSNEGDRLSPLDNSTSAPDAKIDSTHLKEMAGIAAEIFPQYLGEESSRLATQAHIEAPMMKAFVNFQQVLASHDEQVFRFVLEVAGKKTEGLAIDIDFPPIVEKERKTSMEMFDLLLKLWPWMGESEELQALALTTVGLNNADQILEDTQKARETAAAAPEPVPAPAPNEEDEPMAADDRNTLLIQMVNDYRTIADQMTEEETA